MSYANKNTQIRSLISVHVYACINPLILRNLQFFSFIRGLPIVLLSLSKQFKGTLTYNEYNCYRDNGAEGCGFESQPGKSEIIKLSLPTQHLFRIGKIECSGWKG